MTELLIPERWQGDRRFGPDMTESDVDRLLRLPSFEALDPKRYRTTPLRGILKNDCRIVRHRHGAIVVRAKEYATSAFIVLEGAVRVVLPETPIPEDMLGRPVTRKKGWWRALAQLWSNHRGVEYGAPGIHAGRPGAGGDAAPVSGFYLAEVSEVFADKKSVTLAQGQLFGELAALLRHQRTATVVAWGESGQGDVEPVRGYEEFRTLYPEPVVLLEIRWQGLRDLMRDGPAFRDHVNELFRSRSLKDFLRRSPVFHHLVQRDREAELEGEPDRYREDWEQLIQGIEFKTYGKYTWSGRFQTDLIRKADMARVAEEPIITEEGEHPPGLILIRNGLARVTRRRHAGHETLSYLLPGHAFGLEDVIEGAGESTLPNAYTLRAVGYVNVMIVPLHLVKAFIVPWLRPVELQESAVTPVIERAGEEALEGIEPGLTEFLVANRFINGTKTMLIDRDRCTRCDDCVRACASAHDNNPRFIRHGPTYDHYMVANACMHCRDPVCMIPCPTGAIHRNPDPREGSVVINEATCIGCSSCAGACPYDAIRMVEVRDEDGEVRYGRQIDESGQPVGNTEKPIVRATKCDLCIDQHGGPACERACPHDALIRADLGQLTELKAWLDR